MVTHEDDIAAYAKRHLLMRDGHLIKDDGGRLGATPPPVGDHAGGAA